MKKKSDVKERVDTFRTKIESNGQVRADIYIPEELRDRIKAISQNNNWKYLETVAALAALGTEVFESSLEPDQLERSLEQFSQQTIVATNASPSDANYLASATASLAGSLTSPEGALSKSFSYASKPEARSALASFIDKRKGDPK